MFGYVALAQAPFAALGEELVSSDVTVAETASAVDSPTVSSTILGAALSENVSGVDAPETNNSTFRSTMNEAASGIDQISPFNIFLASVMEYAYAIDESDTQSVFVVDVAEAANGVDTQSSGFGLLASISEAASIGSVAATLNSVFNSALSETASIANTTIATVDFAARIAEAATTSAYLMPFAYINGRPVGIQLYVQVGGVLVWAVIDDAQTPSWTIIPV